MIEASLPKRVHLEEHIVYRYMYLIRQSFLSHVYTEKFLLACLCRLNYYSVHNSHVLSFNSQRPVELVAYFMYHNQHPCYMVVQNTAINWKIF